MGWESSDVVTFDLWSLLQVKQWFTGFGELSFWWIQICIGSPLLRSSLKMLFCLLFEIYHAIWKWSYLLFNWQFIKYAFFLLFLFCSIPWVIGYFSQGKSIEVYVDFDEICEEEALAQLMRDTGERPEKYHIKQNEFYP